MRVLKATTPSRPCRKIPKLSIRSPLAQPLVGVELEDSSGSDAAPSPGLDISCPAAFPSSGRDQNIALTPAFAMFISSSGILVKKSLKETSELPERKRPHIGKYVCNVS